MNVYRYFAEYRYRPPMPLEDVSNHYFYCTPGGLPPLAPLKKKKKKVTIIVINDNNNNTVINIPPTTTTVIVPTVPATPTTTLSTVTTAADANVGSLFEDEQCTSCWWGWTVYYWFMHTFPRWYKFFGLIYLFLVDFLPGKDWEDADDDNDNNNINIVINHQVEDDDDDEWIHGVTHVDVNYDYDDEIPIMNEDAPPEAEELVGFEALRQLLLPQQEEEPTTTSSNVVTAIADVPHYDLSDDDDGSDYYFSLPSEDANNSFVAMGVSEGVDGEDVVPEESIAKDIEDIMPIIEAIDATDDVEDEPIVTDDSTEDVEASTSIDEISVSEDCATASLGSIWVPDPKHGLVRRSARLRLRV